MTRHSDEQTWIVTVQKPGHLVEITVDARDCEQAIRKVLELAELPARKLPGDCVITAKLRDGGQS